MMPLAIVEASPRREQLVVAGMDACLVPGDGACGANWVVKAPPPQGLVLPDFPGIIRGAGAGTPPGKEPQSSQKDQESDRRRR